MYADREEEAMMRRKSATSNGNKRGHSEISNGNKRGHSEVSSRRARSAESTNSSVSRSVSRSPSPPLRRRSRGNDQSPLEDESGSRSSKSLNAEERERELQEKLRNRAMMSKRRKKSDASSHPRSPSRDSDDRKRSEQRRERRRGGGGGGEDLLVKRDDRYEKIRSRGHQRGSSRSRSPSRSSSRPRRRVESASSKREDSRRITPEDDEYDRRRRRVDRTEDGYNDSHSYQRDRRPDPYFDPYYDRRSGNGNGYYPPPGHPRRGGYPDRYNSGGSGYGGGEDYHERPPRSRHTRSPSPPSRRRRGESKAKTPDPDDYELRSVFCSQLAARLGQRDLGEFFEDKLGEGTVRDVRIVTDKNTNRSKGIGYVELKDEVLVTQAIGFSGTPLFGIPLLIQRTEAVRNRTQTASSSDALSRPNLSDLSSELLNGMPSINGEPIHIDPASSSGASSRLYVGSLHFSLTEEDIKAVFEPFGAIVSVDLHREPGTLKSKGFAFVQFVNSSSAEKAIQHMNGFDLAGRQIKVGHVASRGSGAATTSSTGGGGGASAPGYDASGASATMTSSFDEGGGGGLNASSRAALMEKLARVEQPSISAAPSEQQRPLTIPQAMSKAVLLKNMFNPEDETERGWDKDLAEDVKEECEDKYGKVMAIKVDVDSAGEIWLKFDNIEGAQKAITGLNGRFFGGRSISAAFVSEGIFNSLS